MPGALMQVFLIGSFLWVVAVAAAWRIVRRLAPAAARRPGIWIWAMMLALATVLMFRPHEDIFGGEDPGAYLNAGITYGRLGRFFYIDDMLTLVQPELRPEFYFGHSGYGPTKDACLWVRHELLALIGPHFQPAYSLLGAIAMRLTGTPDAALYVVPFFALLGALALSVLAANLLPWRHCGIAAFWLFLLNPLTVWHGRAPRPEIIAAAMLFTGLALLSVPTPGGQGRFNLDVWLGAICLMLAPFFHVTAWYVAVPAAALLVVGVGAGRREWLSAVLVAILSLHALDYQARRITDYYGLGCMMRQVIGDPRIWPLCAVAIGGLLAAGWAIRQRQTYLFTAQRVRVGAWLIASAGVLLPLFCYFRRDVPGALPFLGKPLEHFLYMTDFQALTNMVSVPTACAGMAGWLVWCLWPPIRRLDRRDARALTVRLAVAAVVLPGIMFAGRINDFMMTRYLMVTVVPMLALSLAALAGAVGAMAVRLPPLAPAIHRRLPAVVVMILTILLAWMGLWGRIHLLTLTEYNGLANFLRPFAQLVQAAEGALIVEYSRLAAPFDHYFGLPVLGIDNERRPDYELIEAELERLIYDFPTVPAYFITPFHAPVSDRFAFTPVLQGKFEYQRLRQAGRSLPSEVRHNSMTLSMYRMRLADKAPSACRDWAEPYCVQFDAGNMGLRRFAATRSGNWAIRCAAWNELRALCPAVTPAENLLLLALEGNNPVSSVRKLGLSLGNGWRALHLPAHLVGAEADELDAVAGCTLWSGQRLTLDLLATAPLEMLTKRDMLPFDARWARTDAAILLPRPPTPTGRLLLLGRAPPDGSHLTLTAEGGVLWSGRLSPMEWKWVAAPFHRRLDEPEWVWVKIQAQPAWDSGAAGFPSDLGLLAGMIVVLP